MLKVIVIGLVVLGVVLFVMLTDPSVGFTVSATVFAVSLYFLPSLIASGREHPSTVAIFFLNLLAGWTFVGWVIALVWSLAAKQQDVVVLNDTAETPVDNQATETVTHYVSASAPKYQRILDENLDEWLEDRWRMVKSGELIVPAWYSSPVTERQLNRISSYGLICPQVNRGQASDIIGLFEEPDADDLEMLRFFKHSIRGMSQAKARHLCELIRRDADNLSRYQQRPASIIHKRLYAFCGIKVPENLTMERFQRDYDVMSASDRFSDSVMVWDDYKASFDELQSREVREDYEIKRVSQSVFDSAINGLVKSGVSIQDAVSDLHLIVEQILEIKPELQK